MSTVILDETSNVVSAVGGPVVRIEYGGSLGFRVAEYPDGSKRIQSSYRWEQGMHAGVAWKDLPVVYVDSKGQEVRNG